MSGANWFSSLGSKLIGIAHQQIATEKDACNRYWQSAVDLSFTDGTETNPALSGTCRKVLLELGLGSRENTDADSPLWVYLLIVGWLIEAEREGEIGRALKYTFAAGTMWGELESRWKWQAPVEKWNKAALGGEANRLASDADRYEFVQAIILERAKGARDGFRIAAQRRPDWGSEPTFRQSFYAHKKASNKGD